MSAEPRAALVVIARRPTYGQGKRRLAAEQGDLAAHRFQKYALAALLRRLGRDPRWRLVLALTPDQGATPHPFRAARIVPQGPGDLGARLTRLTKSIASHPILFIGADAPQVTRADIAAALKALGGADAVLGPTPDGGFWLIGLGRRARRKPPFSGVRWSSAHARADTLERLQGLRVALLREIEDVDDAASHDRVLHRGNRWRA